MREIKYTNCRNETVVFNDGKGLFCDEASLRSHEWKTVTKGNRIAGYKKGIKEKSLNIVVNSGSYETDMKLLNKLYEVTDKDALLGKLGKLWLDGYYFSCSIIEHNYRGIYFDGATTLTVKAVSDNPKWVKETSITFSPVETDVESYEYPYDYPYDFASDNVKMQIINYWMMPSNFRLTIFGKISNPAVFVNLHQYGVYADVKKDEYLVIDSKEKTIELHRNDGTIVNLFDNRLYDSYVFEKIPSGENSVSFSNDFTFTITLYEERGEPSWI